MDKTAIATRLLARVREQPTTASIPRLDRSAAVPLSFAQLRLWLLDRLAPGSSEYVIPCAFRVRGALDVGALEAAFSDVARRHEVLRTRFTLVGDEPVQVIDAEPRVAVRLVDVSGESGAREREARAMVAIERDAVLAFDLTTDHPVRVTLARLAEDEHLLLIALHHIAADGWSIGVLTRELAAYYESARTGRPAELAALPAQYADYAAWQRDWLTGGVLERQLAYWRGRLAHLEPLELPTDRPRPVERSGAGASLRFDVPAGTATRLAQLATGQGCSLFMAALGAFAVVLSRWSGRDDIAVGSPIAGRTRAETEDLVGFFVNTLVLRTDTSGDPTFTELLGRVRDVALGAYAHQDLPFERLVEELAPERDLSRNPLFELSFVFQNFQEGRWELPGVDVDPVDVPTRTSKFDLLFAIDERADGGLDGEVTFATELFDESTARRLAEHFTRVVEQVTAHPERRIGQIDLLSAAERDQILSVWNDTATAYPETTVHELVEAQAARTPDAIAVAHRERRLSYAELDDRADRLAAHLHQHGVTRGSRVGICAERSPELVVALLGVLKAGAAFVPLDPEHPAERLGLMIEDAAISVVITHGQVRDRVPGGAGAVIDLDEPHATQRAERTASRTGPDDAVYVMYTSGSTGTPKGVVNTHRGIVNRLLWGQDTFRLNPLDRVLQKTPYSFDVSVWEIFWPLIVGARLVMADPDGHRDPRYLRDTLKSQRITTAHFVPSMLREFADAVDLAEFTDLRHVFCSGEALPADLARRFLHARPSCPLHNLYGPTEASIEVSHWECSPDTTGPGVPIGRPIANTELLVMDKAGRLAPIGVPGELWIGGAGVALGYLNRPELTAERFTRHPFSPDPDARVYRSGDLVRRLPDGAVEYLGRIDRQVKLRGLRIELGEVESALVGHASVASGAVVVREDEPGDQRLVAYCVPAPGERIDPARLRRWCQRSLPGYMVPGWIVPLDELPLTPSGKVDHRALPRPADDSSAPDREYTAPRTDTERLIADIWTDLLGRDRVGVHDNFFDIGGHSLLAVRLVNRLSTALGVDVALRALFTAPSIARLAAHLDAPNAPRGVPTSQDQDLAPLLSLRDRGDRTPLFCVYPALGVGWAFTALLPHLAGRSVHALQAPALTDERHLPDSVEAIAADCVQRVQAVQPHGPYLLVGRSFGGLTAYEMGAQLERAGERVALLALLDSIPADPDAAPDPDQAEAVEQDSLRILWRTGRPGDPLPTGVKLDRAQTIAAVQAADGPMRGWSTRKLDRLLEVCATNIELAGAYQPKDYSGRLHLFSATADPDRPSSAAKAARWQRFAPDVVVSELHCLHSDILNPGPAASIAAELSQALDQLDL